MMTVGNMSVNGITCIILAIILNCGQALAQAPPTATEAFNLRTKCKTMSDEKAAEFLQLNTAAGWKIDLAWNTSKYDPINNRCYGRLYEHITKQNYGYDSVSDQIYDLQTDDLLANAQIKNGKKSGNIFDAADYKKPWLPSCRGGCPPDFGDQTWQAVQDYMNEFMADPRKQ
jgi:hypothetical protein